MKTLSALKVLDTAPEERFDDLTRLACMIFKVPIALVSLVDKDRQWFKSHQGLAATFTDRKSSFCAWTLLPQHPEVLVVENTLTDARFKDNALVAGPPGIRFYAGCPLVASNKMRYGSLCIIDREPRTFTADNCQMLSNLAEMVVRELEKEVLLEEQRQRSEMLSQENTQLLRAIDAFSEGIVLVDVSLDEWPVVFCNEAWESLTCFERDQIGSGFWQHFSLPDDQRNKVRAQIETAIEEQEGFDLSVQFVNRTTGEKQWIGLQMRCASTETMDQYMPLVGIPNILPMDAPTADKVKEEEETESIYYFATLNPNQVSSSKNASSAGNSRSSNPRNAFSLSNKVDPFDDVKLGQLLGTGSYGRVYRGMWNGAVVAVKVLEHLQRDDDPGAPDKEAILNGQLSHPSIVQMYKSCAREIGHSQEEDGKSIMETWMVMEYCNKGSLCDAVDKGWFRSKTSLFEPDWKALIVTAKEIASAMCYLHGCNILHGDLTSNNILLAGGEKDQRMFVSKVADFGLSRVLDLGNDTIQTKTYGTVTYMPPELLMEGKMTKACDVYGYGVIVWEMYMAQRPWSGLSHGQIIHQVCFFFRAVLWVLNEQSFLLLAMYGGGPRRGVKGTPDSVCVSFWTAASPCDWPSTFQHTAVISACTLLVMFCLNISSFCLFVYSVYHTAVVSAHTQFARDDLLQRIPAHTQTAIPESVQPATSCSIKTSLNSINTNA